MASVYEDPKRLVEMYAQLVEERAKFLLAPTATYPDFLWHGTYPPIFWEVPDEVSESAGRSMRFGGNSIR
jgi:hypothetical protein